LNSKTVSLLGYPEMIPCTKFEHFGIIRFWVMLRTNKQTNRQTDKQTDSKILRNFQWWGRGPFGHSCQHGQVPWTPYWGRCTELWRDRQMRPWWTVQRCERSVASTRNTASQTWSDVDGTSTSLWRSSYARIFDLRDLQTMTSHLSIKTVKR